MTRFDFISQLQTKFAQKIKDKDSDGVKKDKQDQNEQFFTDLNEFCDSCEEMHLQSVYNHVNRTHEFSTIPQSAKFWKFANKNDFLKKKNIVTDPTWNVCVDCGTKYSKLGRGCPKCMSFKAMIGTGETVPGDLIKVQEDCYYCVDIYKVTLENERRLSGPSCGDYGIKITPHCERCMCLECCKQMIKYNNDPKGTTEMYKSTELGQPWLAQAPPLNDIVEQMVKDMKTGYKQKQEDKGAKNE